MGGRSYQDERIKNKSETGKVNETESGMGVKSKGGEEWGRNRRREKEIRQKNEEGEGSPGSDGRRGDRPVSQLVLHPTPLPPVLASAQQILCPTSSTLVLGAPGHLLGPDQGIRPALHPCRLDEGATPPVMSNGLP